MNRKAGRLRSLKALEHGQMVVLWSLQPRAQKEGDPIKHAGPVWTEVASLSFSQDAP